ncbi:tetratricopeptide repeat protein [Lentzea tibetensis]|uniref:Tetratricopeptide repeat protein n=1 Tax=Lentzea tibetensis TaxID=2591470 RepID=A0A563EI04_9PSEU|nr:tetratricopeptide repeat protein [Lentzea tibetensis]TWP46143.1 tetratricopeptide repeat protein [Lentzea tibetensis]
MGRGAWVLATTIAVVAAVAAPAVLKVLGVNDWRWLLLGAVGGALVGIPLKVYEDKIKRVFQRREDSVLSLSRAALAGGKCRVRDIADPTLLGVHRSLESTQPPYVRRDVFDEVVDNLRPGSFVLLVGDSTAGKTRTAFEAIAAALPRSRLVAPETRDVLDAAVDAVAAAKESVLWLDDLERFLGSGGLTVAAIARVRSGVIVATLRREELHRLTEGDDSQLGDDVRRVLDQAHSIALERRFTAEEVGRAEALRSNPQISDALEHSGEYGLAEYLAAGPVLLAHWENAKAPRAKPRGAALVTAAIDCRRAGFLAPIPRALLTEVHEQYLSQRDRPESVDEAWEWVTTPPRRATSALLEPSSDGHVKVFDYLVDHVQRASAAGDHVPSDVVLAAINHADAPTSHDIGHIAMPGGRYSLAHTAFTNAVHLFGQEHEPDRDRLLVSQHELALVLSEQGEFAAAADEFRAVLASFVSHFGSEHTYTLTCRNNLANTLYQQDDLAAAAAEHRAILEARLRNGSEEHDILISRNNLAIVLNAQGDVTAAVAEYRAVLEAKLRSLGPEDPSTLVSRHNLATALADQGDLTTAIAEHRAVIAIQVRTLGPEHPDTLLSRNNLAAALADQGDLTTAIAEYRTTLAIQTRTLGPDHPGTVRSRRNLQAAEAELRTRGEVDQSRPPR